MDINNILSLISNKNAPIPCIANYFSPGPGRASWGPRIISDYELIYQVEGSGQYLESNGLPRPLKQDQVLLIPPDTEHTFMCPGPEASIISCIHFSFTPQVKFFKSAIFDVSGDHNILFLFKSIAGEYDNRSPYVSTIMSSQLTEIWLRILRCRQQQHNIPDTVTNARSYIKNFYYHPITRVSLARSLRITPEHLNFLFKTHCRTTPLAYLTFIRMNHAKRLLKETNLSVKEIAFKVGYQDPLYFSRVFHKHTGISPRQYIEL